MGTVTLLEMADDILKEIFSILSDKKYVWLIVASGNLPPPFTNTSLRSIQLILPKIALSQL